MRKGKKSISQTPAPLKDRVKGSKNNPKGSAASKTAALSIKLSDSIITTLENKRDEYNKDHSKKVTLNTLKAVMRRGMGAYSTSHRPTISGGAPNSRQAWGFARVNKFLLKKGGTKVKAAYVQDDDLMKDGGLLKSLSIGMDKLKKNGIVLKDNNETITLIAYNTGNQPRTPSLYNKSLIYRSIQPIKEANEIIQNFDLQNFEKFDEDKINDYKKGHLIILNQNEVIYDSKNPNMRYENGGDMKYFKGGEIEGFNELQKTIYSQTWSDKNRLIFKFPNESIAIIYGSSYEDLDDFYKGIDKDFIKKIIYETYGGNIADLVINDINKKKAENFKITKDVNLEEYNNIMVLNNYNVRLLTNGKSFKKDKNLLAPNGKPSNLTPEQYKLVRTPQFKAWFGDWENDLKNASKVVDDNGEPMVMYRGDSASSKKGYVFKTGFNRLGFVDRERLPNKYFFYFTDKYHVANSYAENQISEHNSDIKYYGKKGKFWYPKVTEYFLNIRNPIDFTPNNPLFPKYEDILKKEKSSRSKLDYDDLNIMLPSNYGYNISITEFINIIEDTLGKDYLMLDSDYKYANMEVQSLKNYIQRNLMAYPRYEDTWGYFIEYKHTKTWSDILYRIYQKLINSKYDGLLFLESTGYEDVALADWDMGNAKKKKLVYDYKDWEHKPKIYAALYSEQIKLADGSNTTFDPKNEDIRYEGGGETGEEITCHNCGWDWNTDDSQKFDKYVCHKCGYDNKEYYNLYKRGGNLPVGKLARGMSVSEVAAVHGLQAKDIKKELILGIETEMEHTDKSEYARAIALDHLYEDPRYYTKLKKMEGLDKHYEDISKKYANGGTIQEVFHLTTPTGEKSSLSYLQQVLVRTKAFKNWFGDWEMAARLFLQDGKENFEKHYKDVSKVLDYNTLEPRVVYHGTRVENEFFVFDATREAGQGRPYGYFAHNIEYSQNFTTSSQRGHSGAKPYLYQCFINVRNPFMAIGQQYEGKSWSASDMLFIITASIMWDKYNSIKSTPQTEGLVLAVKSQIGKYLEDTWRGGNEPFWVAMARDINKDFKFFLLSYGYDGIFYGEQYTDPYDIDDPSQYTRAVCIFDSNQVKLADGRNIDFDPMNVDIRFKEGGKLMEQENESPNHENMNKREHLRSILIGEKYAEGGKVVGKELSNTNDGKKGGYFKGRSHAEGGIKAYNVDTGQHIEVEGEEVIITKGAVNDTEKREFEGEMLTNREILSRINQSGGGVAFEDGGEIKGHECGCSGKKYKYGGELMEDFNIMRKMNEPFNLAQKNLQQARSFVDDLISKMR